MRVHPKRKQKRQMNKLPYIFVSVLGLLIIALCALLIEPAKPENVAESNGETVAESVSLIAGSSETESVETKVTEKETEEKETKASDGEERNFQMIDGSRYLILSNGKKATGLYTFKNGDMCIFTDDGRQYINSVGAVGKDRYYCGEDGYVVKDQTFTFPDGSKGIAKKDGKLYTGCVLMGSEVYDFTSEGKLRHTIDATKPMVAVTYDDGPSTKNTLAILDILKANGAYATFFVCGRGVEANADIIQATEDSGSEIGNHTFNHYMLSCMDLQVTTQELSATSSLVAQITHNRPCICRPPTGSMTDAAKANAAQVDDGYPLILWSVDTIDWQHHDSAQSCQTIREKVQDGSIILMHDMEASSVETSRIIIPELIQRGFELVTVSELAAARGGMVPGETYNSFPPVAATQAAETQVAAN